LPLEWAIEWAIGINNTNTFQLNLSSMNIVAASDLGRVWALEWAWHIRVTNLRGVQGYGI